MKKMIYVLLVSLLAFSLCACSSGKNGQSSQSQEPSAEEGGETPQESSEAEKEESNASTEVNEYGVTNEEMQALTDTIKEKVTNDYLNVYNISPSDFSWPGAETEFWGKTGAVINAAGAAGGFVSYPKSVLEDLPDEDAALAKALMSGIAEWEDKKDGDFMPIFFALSDENGLSVEKTAQFFADNVAFE